MCWGKHKATGYYQLKWMHVPRNVFVEFTHIFLRLMQIPHLVDTQGLMCSFMTRILFFVFSLTRQFLVCPQSLVPQESSVNVYFP